MRATALLPVYGVLVSGSLQSDFTSFRENSHINVVGSFSEQSSVYILEK